jgi:arylsulfatase A-like enzyme
MRRSRLKTLASLVLLVVLGLLTACRSVETPQRPNVVVILIDTLRADHLGFYGYPKELAPFLARIAEESVVFDRAFSTSSWTAPSTSSLFTSLYPNQHGVVKGFNMTRKRNARLTREGHDTIELNRLPATVTTLPERFKSMGYTTFGLASNPNIGEEMGFDRGFDHFARDLNWTASDFLEQLTRWEGPIKESHPFFLYLHFNDVHGPYEEREPYYEKQQGWLEDRRARYLSSIGYTDEYIRRIYERLGLDKDTILVVVSDHGEEFHDHGGLAHDPSLYIELNRVVMLFHAPSLGVAPQRIAPNVSLIDVLPTLVELVAGEPVEAAEGMSLVPALRKAPEGDALLKSLNRRMLFAHRLGLVSPRPFWAAMQRQWKLIERPDANLEAYHHGSDPAERQNLYSRDPSQVPVRLISALEEFKAREPVEAPSTIQVEVDEELKKTLESLGYVQ